MNDRQRDRIRERLLEERRGTVQAIAEFDDRFRERLEQGDDDLSKYPQHMADEGTDAQEREKEFLLASQEGRQLLDIDQALRTLYREPDSFGTCDSCGRDIPMERLEVIPWTRLCIECQTSAENGESAAT